MSEKPKDKEIRLEVAAKFVRILAPPQTWFFLSHVELIGHIFVILFEMVTQSWRVVTTLFLGIVWPEASAVLVEKSPLLLQALFIKLISISQTFHYLVLASYVTLFFGYIFITLLWWPIILLLHIKCLVGDF